MGTQTVQITPDGMLVLPEELRNYLKDSQDLQLSWNDEFIVINYKQKKEPEQNLSREEKINRFFEKLDKLQAVNELDPITEEEIQAEIKAYRAEKRLKQQ